ncbi:hypothetical protein YYC_03590 [Plasmodium yoelii 17X]|uniref:Uncharacterized protein n=1 Tax=Plasmodium yoelii 17X TaxID=1323249 RepID=V7PIG5_PLAYE|nr:hypothetical protein YYC_03590 [Plasmodium yoelii 17X]
MLIDIWNKLKQSLQFVIKNENKSSTSSSNNISPCSFEKSSNTFILSTIQSNNPLNCLSFPFPISDANLVLAKSKG